MFPSSSSSGSCRNCPSRVRRHDIARPTADPFLQPPSACPAASRAPYLEALKEPVDAGRGSARRIKVRVRVADVQLPMAQPTEDGRAVRAHHFVAARALSRKREGGCDPLCSRPLCPRPLHSKKNPLMFEPLAYLHDFRAACGAGLGRAGNHVFRGLLRYELQ